MQNLNSIVILLNKHYSQCWIFILLFVFISFPSCRTTSLTTFYHYNKTIHIYEYVCVVYTQWMTVILLNCLGKHTHTQTNSSTFSYTYVWKSSMRSALNKFSRQSFYFMYFSFWWRYIPPPYPHHIPYTLHTAHCLYIDVVYFKWRMYG